MLEEISGMEYDEIIFDSSICECELKKTMFVRHLLGRENVGMLLEDDQNNIYGLINKSLIIKFITSNENEMNLIDCVIKTKKIPENNENNTLLFKMREKGKYIDIDKIKQTMKKTECMKIYKSNEPLLFSIGNEMVVKKKGVRSDFVIENKIYGIQFNPIRIIFIQLKDKNKTPNRKHMCITSLTTDQFIGKLDDDTFDLKK